MSIQSCPQLTTKLGIIGRTKDLPVQIQERAMRQNSRSLMTALILSLLLLPAFVAAQVTRSDYERAGKLREKFQGLAINISERANAIEATSRFWYRKSVTGGNEFVLVDADTATKKAAFDHAKLAASLSAANGQSYTAVTLPFSTIT